VCQVRRSASCATGETTTISNTRGCYELHSVTKDKSNLIVGGGLIYIAIAEYSSEVPYPWRFLARVSSPRPDSRRFVFGYLGAGKLDEFLPDENGIFLIAFQASDDTGGAIWEITEDQFDAMEVHPGTLFEWPTAKRVYEVKEYRPEENVAVANWRESIAGSNSLAIVWWPTRSTTSKKSEPC